MTITNIKVTKWKKSLRIIIPEDIVRIENIHKGDIVKVDIIKNRSIDGFGMFKGVGLFIRDKEEHDDLW